MEASSLTRISAMDNRRPGRVHRVHEGTSTPRLLRRHDYRVDIAGSFGVSQYLHFYTDDGIIHRDRLLVSLDFSEFRLSTAEDSSV
ncbi:hypothetical protein [Mycolicibacterium smegmatis]|uniref:Uncharacterized protein n=1 Tax=Mycolicibacterium smegmatis TaxID=1772 RepID=A0A653FKW8_MYCSM|nr:hypothetical protein [Mycolicibacterium smegmatis]MBE9620823.1 hypothetical protein [Mycolicibacterium smegmatis]MBE9627142.1 hypothetical protein [Mycolicibacterium smegmatis]MBE9633578.1 hypothetical protein [Mycolicibacterium smegmatis]MBE9645773.1 hypothetical protein [Mycolicibacterium smegmatis]MBE9652328.1 hypothetical protein [Mycolicibacterium smegmatis]